LERYKYEGDTEKFILPAGTETPPWKEEFSKYVKIAWEFTEATTDLTDEIVATYYPRAQFIQAYDVLKFLYLSLYLQKYSKSSFRMIRY
jgi:hypothetical protein